MRLPMLQDCTLLQRRFVRRWGWLAPPAWWPCRDLFSTTPQECQSEESTTPKTSPNGSRKTGGDVRYHFLSRYVFRTMSSRNKRKNENPFLTHALFCLFLNTPQLMKVLSDPQNSHIISWMPGGRSFAVVNPKKFVEEILPKDFKSAKYASFTRKLHRWGFLRVDDISGEFYHRLFQRNRFDLAEKMSCHKTDEEPKSLQARNGSAPKCASKSDGAVAAADEKKSSAGPPADQLSHSNNSTGSSSSSGATHQVQASPNPSRGCAVPTTPSLRALQQQGMSSPPSPMAAVSRQLQFGGVTPQEQANLRAELQTAELLTLLREQKFQQTKLELSAARYRRLAALSMSALSPSASMAGTQSFTLPPSSQLFGRMGRHHPHEAGATTDDAPPSSPMTPNTEGAKTA